MRYTVENTSLVDLMANVFLDGKPVNECVEADDDLGFVVVIDRASVGGKKLLIGAVSVVMDQQQIQG